MVTQRPKGDEGYCDRYLFLELGCDVEKLDIHV